MPRTAQSFTPLDKYVRLSNRARLLEEVSHGLTMLLRASGKNKAWLARTLGVSPAHISQILEGSHNFTLEALADITLAFGVGAHVRWSPDPSKMQIPRTIRPKLAAGAVRRRK